MRYLGVQGLALAYSLALFVQMSLVLSLLAKEIGNFFQKDVFIFALKVMLAAGVSSGIVHAFLLVFQFGV
jgi:peptidoglycan biosynthesis protein MviN/MurJ (putative lipid II flippase)